MRRVLLLLVGMVAVSVTLPAQSQLDVVSVRENPARNPPFNVDFAFRPGRFDIVNLPLEGLVAHGYGITSLRLRDQLIVGWPNSEIREKRFDIRGTLSTNETLSFEDQRRVVLEVLETRFGLQTHREQRLFDGRVMTLAKPGCWGRA